jgi:hypothetical protein
MKNDKKIYKLLEQMYNTNINEPRADSQAGSAEYEDLPYVYDDNEYKTSLRMEDAQEEIEDKFEDPIITTKKGKNVLREPPSPDPEDSEIHAIKVIEIKTLDRSEPEETINVDEFLNLFEAKKEKDLKKKKEKESKKDSEDEDPNDMSDIAQSAQDTGEQNPGMGTDPNMDPNQMQPDPNAMMGGQGGAYQDPNAMAGLGQQGVGGEDIDPMTGQPKITLDVVGKVYELKKIYSRLLAIQSQLSFSPDMTLLQLRKFITKAIDLFETVISNIGLYKKEIDDIIIMYYKFIEEVYDIMKDFYKKKAKEEKEGNKEKTKKEPEDKSPWKNYL